MTGVSFFANSEETAPESSNQVVSAETSDTYVAGKTERLIFARDFMYEKFRPGQQGQYRSYYHRSPQEETTQPRARRGYIGVGAGGAVAIESTPYNADESDLVGTQLTINFGYLFSRRVGIAASLIHSSYDYYFYGTSGLIAGPLFSFGKANGNFAFDIRPGVGFANAVDSYDENGFIYNIGLSWRWGLGRYISMSANLDYYEGPGTPALGVSLGVNYRLK